MRITATRTTIRAFAMFGIVLGMALSGCASPKGGPTANDASADVAITTVYETIENTNPVICKKIIPTGSHLPKRFCTTKRKWEEITAASQAMSRTLDGPAPPSLSR